jgi:hypothetical protein
MFRKLKNWSCCTLLFTVAMVGCGGGSVTVPSTPDGTVETVTKSLADFKPQVLWSASPSKYQADIKELIQLFAANMDKEVYDKGIATVDKVASILRSKKDFIKNSSMIKGQLEANKVNPDEFGNQLEAIAKIVETLTKSDLGSIDKVKSLDPEKFLATTGSQLMKNSYDIAKMFDKNGDIPPLDKAKEVKATVVENKDGKAKLKVETYKGTKEETMVQVDGKWVPELIASDWDKGVAENKQKMKDLKVTSDNKTQILTMIGGIDGALSGLADAKTQEDFDKAIMGIAMMAMSGGGGPPPGFGPPPGN